MTLKSKMREEFEKICKETNATNVKISPPPHQVLAFIEHYMDLAREEGRLAGIKECIKDSIKQSNK